MKIIFVRLLNEGVEAYRPVPALEKGDNIFEIQGYDIYDGEDETWEFLPGTNVLVKERLSDGELILVAVSSI